LTGRVVPTHLLDSIGAACGAISDAALRSEGPAQLDDL
jgi:hypothetical protein